MIYIIFIENIKKMIKYETFLKMVKKVLRLKNFSAPTPNIGFRKFYAHSNRNVQLNKSYHFSFLDFRWISCEKYLKLKISKNLEKCQNNSRFLASFGQYKKGKPNFA